MNRIVKYVYLLAIVACVLFTAIFWSIWGIALSEGLFYRFWFWKFGVGMTVITFAVVAAFVCCRFFDLHRVEVQAAFLAFEAALIYLWPIFLFYYLGFNPEGVEYSEKDMNCNYIEVKLLDYPEPTRYYYAKQEKMLFMKFIEWGPEDNVVMLNDKYGTEFSYIECSDGTIRYIPEKHPQVKVRVYGHGTTYDLFDNFISDDYLDKLVTELTLECYKKNDMPWEYEIILPEDGSSEGQLYFIINENDDFIEYSKDLAEIVTANLKDPLFNRWHGTIGIKFEKCNHKDWLGFGVGDQVISPDYYTKWQNVLSGLNSDLMD